MSSAVTVWADGSTPAIAGTLHSTRRRGAESSTFTYAPGYLANPAGFALDPRLQLSASPHHTPPGIALFGVMSDGAPDRWGRTLLLRREARAAQEERRAARSLGDIDFLLGVRDDVRQGALRYSMAEGPFLATEHDGVPALTDLPALLGLSELAERDSASLPDLQRLIYAGGSLGGARPKAHVIDVNGRLAIAKFPSADRDTWDVMTWEQVALILARAAGIDVPPSRLLRVGGRSVLLVERFDRILVGEGARRVGYASAMTLLEATDGTAASYIDIAAAVEEYSDRTSADLSQLWRRMLFNVAIGNTDDHLRNHGFLHASDRDAWRLSPAFDMNPTPAPGAKTHATSVDASGEPATFARVMAVAPDFRLGPDAAATIRADVLGAVAGWATVARAQGLAPAAITAMAPAFDALGG